MADWQVDRRADGSWRAEREAMPARVAWAVTDAEGAVWVQIDGDVVVVPSASSTRTGAQRHGHATLEAPMPAQVTAVLVAPGDVVPRGATLVLLEAMKMELPVKAPADGRVERVHCAPGDRVAPGRTLVDIGPAPETA